MRRFAALLIVLASVAGCDGARETMDSGRTSPSRSQVSRSPVPAPTRLATASTAPIVFVRGRRELVRINPDGKGMRVLTRMPPGYEIASDVWTSASRPVVWSPDGRRIAFVAGSEIFVVNADGSGRRRLTNNPDSNSNPTWSPDGTKIAFDRNHDGYNTISVVNAVGSGERRLIPWDYFGDPVWSTDGQRIAFRNLHRPKWLYVMNSDGSGRRRLIRNDDLARRPSARKLARLGFTGVWLLNAGGSRRWRVEDLGGSHDGRRIAFADVNEEGNDSDIVVVDADGTRLRRLTRTSPHLEVKPSWSPDGKSLVFSTSVAPWEKGGLYVVNADGSGKRKLTDTEESERLPAWSPKR